MKFLFGRRKLEERATRLYFVAVAQARRLGFGRKTPIYYDMEAYHPGARFAALKFLSAWTAELHRFSYSAGVYSSSDSGIVDLSRQYSGRRYAMPNVIYDALWNGSASTRDRNLRAGQWPLKRLPPFRGTVPPRYGRHPDNHDEGHPNYHGPPAVGPPARERAHSAGIRGETPLLFSRRIKR